MTGSCPAELSPGGLHRRSRCCTLRPLDPRNPGQTGRFSSLSSSQLWLPFWGSGLPSPDPHTQPPTGVSAGLGLSSRTVITKSGEVWSFPALGEKIGWGCPCLVRVGKAGCIANYWGFGPGPQWTGCRLCLGWAVIKASPSAQRMWPGPSWKRSKSHSLLDGYHFLTSLLK